MSIASATAKSGPYAGNGIAVAFAVGFACQAATDLVVVRTDALDVDTTLTYVTDYSVVLNADQVASPGGTVTLAVAPAVGVRVTILRNVALTQGSQLPNQGAWYPKVVENALDKLTMIVQQLSERVSRSVQVGVTAGDTSTFVAAIFAAASNAANAANSAANATNSAANAANSAAAAAASADSIALPDQTGHAGHTLKSDGENEYWAPDPVSETFDSVPMPALDIDLSLGNYFTKTVAANSTFTFSNVPAAGCSWTLELQVDAGTVFTFPTTVKPMNNGVVPPLTVGKTHLLMFVKKSGSTRVRMSVSVNSEN